MTPWAPYGSCAFADIAAFVRLQQIAATAIGKL